MESREEQEEDQEQDDEQEQEKEAAVLQEIASDGWMR